MLRSLGFEAAVLEGGFEKWRTEGRPTESGKPKGYPSATFVAAPRPGLFVDKPAVLGAIGRPGRIPGSVQVSAATLVDPVGQGFTTLADAQAKFAAKGVTPDKHVIAYCGGGISATIDLFLLHQLGYDDITLYDASMGEWARDESVPIENG